MLFDILDRSTAEEKHGVLPSDLEKVRFIPDPLYIEDAEIVVGDGKNFYVECNPLTSTGFLVHKNGVDKKLELLVDRYPKIYRLK